MFDFFKSLPGIICVIGIIVLVFGPSMLPAALAVNYQLIMQIVVSLVILGAGLYVILSQKYSADAQKMASGWIGMVIGFWLPS